MASPLLFMAVKEAPPCEAREGLPWKLLYASDFVLLAERVRV